MIPQLNTIQKVGATVGAVVTALGITYGVTSVVEDTACGPNAAVVDVQFRSFNKAHGEDLKDDENFNAVLNFFKAPRTAKLFAVPVEDKLVYVYLEKGTKDEDGNWATGWKQYKTASSIEKTTLTLKVGPNDVAIKEKLLEDKAVLKDWYAVRQFMKDWQAAHPQAKAVETEMQEVNEEVQPRIETEKADSKTAQETTESSQKTEAKSAQD